MNLNEEYQKLFMSYALENSLDTDIDTWPEDKQNEFFAKYDNLKSESDAAQPEEDESFYFLTLTTDELDTSSTEQIDIRKMSLEELRVLIDMFPEYAEYYYTRLLESR